MKAYAILSSIIVVAVSCFLLIGCFAGENVESDLDVYFDSGNGGWDEAYGIVVDSSGFVYVVGYGNSLVSGSNHLDWWIKSFWTSLEEYTSPERWEKKISHLDSGQDQAYDIALDSSNNLYIVGSGTNIVGGAASSGQDWWIKKFDKDGNELNFGGSSLPASGSGDSPCSTNGLDRACDGNSATDVTWTVAVDSDDNVYVAGYGDNVVSGSSFHDWWIKKFSSSGVELDFGGSSLPVSGGGNSPCSTNGLDVVYDGGNDDADVIADIVIDADDNVYVIGFSRNLAGFSSDIDWWIKKFSSSGVELDFGGSGYPAVGSYDSPSTTNDLDVVFDSSGGQTGFYDDRAWCGTIDAGGHLYIVGEGWDLVNETSRTDWWIKKFDLDGTEELTAEKKIDGGSGETETAVAVAADQYNNVYVAGYGYNMASDSSGNDWWLKKFNSEGTECTEWEKILDGNGEDDKPRSIVIHGNSFAYVAGYGSNLSYSSSGFDWWIHRFGLK